MGAEVGAKGVGALLSGDAEGKIFLWDIKTGELLRSLEGKTSPVNSLDIAAGKAVAASGHEDGTLVLWDLKTGTEIKTLKGPSPVFGAAISQDGGKIFAGSQDLYFREWDSQTGAILTEQSVSCGATNLAMEQNERVAFLSCENLVYTWDVANWRLLQQFVEHATRINAIAISADGRTGLSASEDKTLRIWRLTNRWDYQAYNFGFPSWAVAPSPDGKYLLLGSDPPRLWDIAQRKVVKSYLGAESGPGPAAAKISPDGRMVAIAGTSMRDLSARTLVAWDLQTGEKICSFSGHKEIIRTLAFSPDSRYLLSGSQEFRPDKPRVGELILWDIQTCQMLRRFETNEDVPGIEFSADGRQALTGTGYYGRVILWDVASGMEIRRFQTDRYLENWPMLSVAFGPDGKSVLASEFDGAYLWDIETGKIIREYKGNVGFIWSLDISPDGKKILAGTSAGEVILWDFETAEVLFSIQAHQQNVLDVAFSPDGKHGYSVSGDNVMVELKIADPSLTELLDWINANRYVRRLTCEERQQYRVEPLCQ
jgi:WD40 repeat protein